MLLKILLFSLFLFLIILQLNFINTGFVPYLNLVFIILLFLLFTKRPYRLLIFALTAGYIFDLYSQFIFGTYLIAFALTLAAIYLLYKNVFTHHSQLTLISLAITATLSFDLLIFVLTKLAFLINLNNYVYPWSIKVLFWQIFINVFFLLILFYVRKSIFHISR